MTGRFTQKRLPIGMESFQKIRAEGCYYVDKTGLIRDLLYRSGEVNLFTRPRRFGKSLNMSMLKTFFEIGCNKTLFDGLEIAEETELCEAYMGQFPVVSISLKGVNGGDYATARALMCAIIGEEALRLYDVLSNSEKLNAIERKQYEQLIEVDTSGRERFVMSDAVLMGSLKTLCTLLYKHYGKKVIVLIDEYDVPLAKANEQGYYDQMILLIRNMFEQALKTNDSLYFAVLTGCLRVSKESIFNGLNNLTVFSITDVDCDSYFGFTDTEVKEMLAYYELEEKYDSIKEWYDGYRFGDTDVYCPWDVVSYVSKLLTNPKLSPQDYWSNTSGNDVVRHFIEQVDHGLTRGEIEALVAGETVTKEIRTDLTYHNLYRSMENIWSVLFTTGYLTYRGEADGRRYELAIPNREIRGIFTDQIMELFREDTQKDGERLRLFCEALQAGNAAEVEQIFTEYLKDTISIRDTFVRRPTKENFYHGILLGILGFQSGWYVKSNREAGEGYADVVIRVEREEVGIIIEMKYAEQGALASACESALRQIEASGYAAELREDGFCTILKYGMACYKKKCKVMLEREEEESCGKI